MSTGRTPFFRQLQRAYRQSLRSRRDFLHLGTLAGVACALPAGAQDAAAEPAATVAVAKPKGPVAIVGGGVAGLTAAYRLVNAGVEVHLYEALNRFGGRMWTKRDFNKDKMFVELGGELVDTNHSDLLDLAKELDVGIQSLKEGEAGVDFYHFGGKIYTDEDVVAAFGPLGQRIAADLEGIYDANEEFTEKARKLDSISLKDYLATAGVGSASWLAQMLEVAYVPEYGLDADKQSSLNLIDFINPDTTKGFQLFGDSDEAFRVQGGNENLCAALHRAIATKAKLHDNHRLVRIASEGSGIKLSFSNGKAVVSPTYEHVVLALPFSILRDVEGIKKMKLSEEKQRAIQELGYGINLKAMYGFTDRHWRQPAAGRTVFCNGSVYSDKSFQTIWETSRGQAGESGIITNFMGGSPAAQYGPDRIDSFLAEVDGIFPGLKAKHDGNKTMLNWSSMKTTRGSYSSPLVGQYTWVYAAAASAELDGHLIFAGEHTSSESPGFMNGGVESGNRAAKELGAA
jgi:monoamine oxidase